MNEVKLESFSQAAYLAVFFHISNIISVIHMNLILLV